MAEQDKTPTGDGGGQGLDDPTLDLLVLPTGQNVIFPTQSCMLTFRVPDDADGQAIYDLLEKVKTDGSFVVCAVRLGGKQNNMELSKLVTLCMINKLERDEDLIYVHIIAIGRAMTSGPYKTYHDGSREFRVFYSVLVTPFFEPMVTDGEWNNFEYALICGAIMREVEECANLVGQCIAKMRGSVADEADELFGNSLLDALEIAPTMFAKAQNGSAFDRAIRAVLGELSFHRQLNYLAQNSLLDRLNAFHGDILDLIEICELYLFDYDGFVDDDEDDKKTPELKDEKPAEPKKPPQKLLPPKSGGKSKKGTAKSMYAEVCRAASELIQKMDEQIANLKKN